MKSRKIFGVIVLALMVGVGSAWATTNSATVTIKVEGMDCEGCVSSITKKLKATDGVEEVQVSLAKKEAWVKYNDQKVTIAKLREVINSAGYKAL